MANKISEQLFEAVDVLINKRILDSSKDKTILCTIEDNSKAADGEYTVSNASARFTAYSENTKYRKGQNVWVLIPDGDYNNDKLIISKYSRDSNAPYVYVDPMDSFIDMTDNILPEDQTATEMGLLANCDYPISVLSVDSGEGEFEYKQLLDILNEYRLRLPGGYTIDDPQPPAIVLGATAKGGAFTRIDPVPVGELITTDQNNTHILNGVDITGYDKIGIQADFKTVFGSDAPISGSYGLCFIIKAKKESVDEKNKVTIEEKVYNVILDSSQMWGNPYGYFDYFTQSLVIEFNQEELGYPTGIDCYFYQNFDFISEDGSPYPYYMEIGLDENANQPILEYFDKNIFVKNIRLSFGYSVDEITTETLRLYTTSAKVYGSSTSYSKKLKLRYIYVTDDQRKIVINGTAQFIDYAKQISDLTNRYPIIRWYRENNGFNSPDMRRGEEWTEIYAIDDAFNCTAENLSDDVEEGFQCVLYSNVKAPYYLYNLWNVLNDSGDDSELFRFCDLWKQLFDQIYPELEIESIDDEWESAIRSYAIKTLKKDNPDYTEADVIELIAEIKENPAIYPEYTKAKYIQQAWADSDLDGLPSNILTFNNKDDINDISDAKNRGLTLSSGDNSRGVFNFYEATFAADNNLINPADEFIPRKINAVFNSKVTGDTGLMSADRLAWYVPRSNTMIHAPSNGRTYNGTRIEGNATIALPQYCFSTQADIDAYKDNLSDEEYALFSQRIRSYYIVLEDWTEEGHTKPTENLVSLIYYIKPKLIKQWTNNTILASMYRNQQIYEGENAKITLTFNVKGANGTNYTLVAQMTDEFVGVLDANEDTWTLNSSPSAWTYNYDSASDQNTCAIRLVTALYDVNDKQIQGASFEWEVLYDGNELFSTNKIQNKTINGVYGTWLQINNTRPTWEEREKCHGVILKCTAFINLAEEFSGYVIIPMRNSRDIEALQGASMIRYNSAGVDPQYYTGAYGFVDFNGNIDYTNIVAEMKVPAHHEPDNVIQQYFPEVVLQSKKYYLKAQTMYFDNVDYDCHVKVTKEIDENQTLEWTQPILILVDPYGNSFLNSWNGDLVIDKAKNRIMASVIGAGKKETDNTFTGLLLGNLPEVEGTVDKTGLLGYEHGEQSYGLLDDGTLFLGKASTAQIKFDGTTGMLQNSAFGNGGPGLKMHFTGDDDIAGPYFVMSQDGEMADTTSASTVRIAAASPYFQIKTPKRDGNGNVVTGTSTAILHIGDDNYYMQTSDYSDNSTDGQHGIKFDLKNGTLTSFGTLKIQGDANSEIKFGNGGLKINGDGSINLSRLNFVDSNGVALTVSGAPGAASNITPQWMTFVTSISGSITRDYAPVTVSGSVPYTYTYSTYTTTSLTGNLSFSGSGTLRDANLAAGNVGNTISHTNNAQVSIGGISGFNYDDYNWAFYLPVTVTGALNTTGTKTTTVDVNYRGSTDVPVITNIKLTIQKVSMWALTNSSTITSTITIS